MEPKANLAGGLHATRGRVAGIDFGDAELDWWPPVSSKISASTSTISFLARTALLEGLL
jgi:hypothetical protein